MKNSTARIDHVEDSHHRQRRNAGRRAMDGSIVQDMHELPQSVCPSRGREHIKASIGKRKSIRNDCATNTGIGDG